MFQAKTLEFLSKTPQNIVVETYEEALSVAEVAKYLNIDFILFPDFRANFGDDLRSYKTELFELNTALFHYYQKNSIFISPINTILRKLPTAQNFDSFQIEFADSINLNSLKEKLFLWGYEFVNIIQEKGEVSFRGDIIDIYPINSQTPIRISLFDDEVESIREFDEFTQKSSNEIENFTIIPAVANLTLQKKEKIDQQIELADFDIFYKDFYSLGYWFLDKEPISNKFYFIKDMTQTISEFEIFNKVFNFEIEIIPNSKKCYDFEPKNIPELIESNKNKTIEILSNNAVQLEELNISHSFTQSDIILNIACNDKIIISLNKRKSKKLKNSQIVLDDLKTGDFVVHETHGIGEFIGLKHITVLGKTGDFIEIKYFGGDKLLLPVENLDLIDRYIAVGGALPQLDKLGKNTFLKSKQKAQEKIFNIAGDIIKISAKRDLLSPIKLNFNGLDEFIKSAPFEYTKDQKTTIEEIKKDFSSKVMDRLLSGDVGFGKTEMAMASSFIVANNSYQSVIVAPTTILVNQHYKSFKERFKNYNFIIQKLDSFTSTKEKKVILEGVKNGDIDILLATHSAFNLEFHNLGLVVVDEEHKFGVKQKEKLKNLVENVHMLSMSATPIPRSLNLALSQIKGLSSLTTPPKNKQNTRTFVKEYSETLLKEIINREIRRGGQIFYIHNNISAIEMKKNQLLKTMPNLRIASIHSKLTPKHIEKTMMDFENGEFDLALATTIVESGIHIPSVNTVIVDGADRFGIADLHQIRGRVGRGNKEGYAYFLIENRENITEDAKKRLIALEENSFLGSGAVLAMHDLEIRGGGNIIGEAQSGQIKNIGYSMYVKMLENTLNKMNGISDNNTKEVEVKLNINAYISDELIKEDRIRIELYRRLSKCQNIAEIYEIEKEIIDRFSKIDQITQNFIEKIKIKVLCKKKNIKSISNYSENITIIYNNEKKESFKSPFKDDGAILETIIKQLK